MKKSAAAIVGVVVVLAVAWLGGTWYTGKMLETKSAQSIAQANEKLAEQAPPGVQVQMRESRVLERGFFSSRVRYAVEVVMDSKELRVKFDQPLAFELDVRYEHGPFPLSALARGQFMPHMAFGRVELVNTPATAPWFSLVTGQNPEQGTEKNPLTLESLVSYAGNGQFRLDLAPLRLEKDKVDIQFSGATLQGTVQAGNQHIQAVWHMPEFSMKEPNNATGVLALVRDARVNMDTQINRFETGSGMVELTVDSIKAERGGNTLFELGQLVYGTNTTDDEQFVNVEVYTRAGSVAVKDVALGSPSMRFKFNRLDGQTLKQQSETFKALLASAQRGNPQDAVAVLMEVADELYDGVQTLLRHHPEMVDEFVWTTDKGRSTVDVNIALQPFDAGNAMDWWDSADNGFAELALEAVKSVAVDIEVNQPMITDLYAKFLQLSAKHKPDAAQALAQAEGQLEEGMMIAAMLGLVEKQGDTFKSRWTWDGETISINGREMPLGALMNMLR